jgi:hypothetical protein
MWIGFGKKRNLEFLLGKFFVNVHLEERRRVNDDDDDDDDDNNNNMGTVTVGWED